MKWQIPRKKKTLSKGAHLNKKKQLSHCINGILIIFISSKIKTSGMDNSVGINIDIS